MLTIDQKSGFCFGVVTAIRKAEEELQKGETLYCLGDIVHNGQEVERLEKLGLKTISYEQFRELHNVKVLLRAHGEPPETYQIAQRNGIEIIDASCPVVLNLQSRIRQTYREHPNSQIVIFGKKGHAEVIGLQGQTENKAIVVENEQDLSKVDFSKDIYLFSQTTKSVDEFTRLMSIIEANINRQEHKPVFKAYDTICGQVRNRGQYIRDFAAANDMVIFVGGRNSSNGKVLYEQCRLANPNTVFIEGADEITEEMILDSKGKNIGICGATSTPLWLMEQVKNRMNRI